MPPKPPKLRTHVQSAIVSPVHGPAQHGFFLKHFRLGSRCDVNNLPSHCIPVCCLCSPTGFFLKHFRLGSRCDVNDLPTLDPELYRNLMMLRWGARVKVKAKTDGFPTVFWESLLRRF